jgi:sugar phosphate isomerase/epimerase
MRLSGPIFGAIRGPSDWITKVKRAGYSAASLPLEMTADDAVVRSYLKEAREADILISEVGTWSNPIDPDPAKAKAAIDYCQRSLEWAEKTGARCCVNIAGSRHAKKWEGADPKNFSDEAFQLIVSSVQEIIDAVKPKRTFYTLEAMPWIFPSTPDEYLGLIRAIDRPAFAVHLDPVNMITCPKIYFNNASFLRECFSKLGPYIKSCHAKDTILRGDLTVRLDECRPGLGALDYGIFLAELAKLDPDTPLCLEHLQTEQEYAEAAAFIRSVAK